MCRNPIWPGLSGALAAPSVATWDDLDKVATWAADWPRLRPAVGQFWSANRRTVRGQSSPDRFREGQSQRAGSKAAKGRQGP